jgi:hypothetical protein
VSRSRGKLTSSIDEHPEEAGNMVVHIHALRRSQELARVLRDDGWEVEEGAPRFFEATHPDVDDQPTARARLLRLDLLTSPRLRIEFDPQRPPR